MAGALAEYLLTGQAGNTNSLPVDRSIDSVNLKAVGEEMIMEKLNKIFDEVKNENQEFEESY